MSLLPPVWLQYSRLSLESLVCDAAALYPVNLQPTERAEQAEDLGTNTRYISAVVNVRFHMNYTSFVNKYRIDEAMSILVDKRYQDLRMEEVSDMVGFANRQSFYASFYRIVGMTPRDYRLQHLMQHPSMKASKRARKDKE